MIINRYGEHAFCPLLANHVLVKNRVDFVRNWQSLSTGLTRRLLNFFANDVVAEVDTLIANKDRGASNKLPDFVLAFATKRTVKELVTVCAIFRHYVLPSWGFRIELQPKP